MFKKNVDERNLEMQREWMSIVSHIAKNESIEDGLFFEDISVMKLNDCEQYYKKLDLYFSFARLFGEKYTKFKNAIAQEKEEVSLKIMEELKQSGFDDVKCINPALMSEEDSMNPSTAKRMLSLAINPCE